MSDFLVIITLDIVAVILFAIIACSSIRKFYNIKLRKTTVSFYLNIASIVFSMFFLFIFIIASLCNYGFEKGENLISKNNAAAAKHFSNALKIRQIVGPLDTLLGKKLYGTSIFLSSEMLTRRRLANAYRLNREYQKAIEEYEHVESFYNNNFDVIAGMADSYFYLLNVEKTEYYYEKLTRTERDNKDVNYFYYMGMAYVILRDCNNAEMFLRKSIDLGKDSRGINRLIEKCKSGKREDIYRRVN